MMDEKTAVRGLQEVRFELLKTIDDVCRKNGLQYFIYFGSLIGAIRHKGFIPWDDDIDVAMPREDFQKLLALGEDAFPKGIHLCGPQSKEKVYNLIPTLAIENTGYLSWWNNSRFKTEISIDIFVLDKLSTDPEKAKKQKSGSNFWRSVNFIRNVALSPSKVKGIKKVEYAILLFIHGVLSLFHVSNDWIYHRFMKSIECNENTDMYDIFHSTAADTESCIVSKEDLFPPRDVEFEGHTFMGPNNYDKILTHIYGDYMKLPPKEEQHNPTPRYVKLADGRTFGSEK